VYIAVSCFAALAVRPRLGRHVATILTIAHTSGIVTWLTYILPLGNLFLYCPQVPIGVCLMACLERSIRWEQDTATSRQPQGSGPAGSGTEWPAPQDARPRGPEPSYSQLQPE
jgi:hypothetical protein